MFAETKPIEISHIGAAVPAKQIRVADLPNFTDKKMLSRAMQSTGVKIVRYTAEGETASDLCMVAAERILKASNEIPQCIVFVSSTPDYLSTATSTILQHKLGLSKSTLCFDINYGCSGFIYGLFQAGLILSAVDQVKNVLLLVGETASKNIDPADTSTALIFGDSGSACLVRRSQQSEKTKFYLQADGSGYSSILKSTGGYRNPTGDSCLFMDGGAVMNFITADYQPSIVEFLNLSKAPVQAIDRFYFHQANKLILDYLAKKLVVPNERLPTSYADYGNTGGGSLPLTIAKDLIEFGNNNTSQSCNLLSGFGAGLSWGHTLLSLNHCESSGVIEL